MFKNNKYRFALYKKILSFGKGLTRYFLIYLVSSLFIMSIGFIRPEFYQRFIDDVILGEDFESIYIVFAGYLLLFALEVAISYVKNHSNKYISCALALRIKKRIWDNFFNYSFEKCEKENVGNLKMRLDDDTKQATEHACIQTVDYLVSIITIVVTIILMLYVNLYLSIFSLVAIPLTFILDNAIAKKEKEVNALKRENDQNLSGWLHSSVQAWREIKTLNLDRFYEYTLVKYLHKFALIFVKWINYWTTRGMVIPKIRDVLFSQLGLYFIGGVLIMHDQLQIGKMFVFSMYYTILFNAIKQASTIDAELRANMPYTDRLVESLDSDDEMEFEERRFDDTKSIVFENVSFSYPGEREPILKNFNLSIKKGEKVAIIGASGSGKSTLLKLITGMLKPSQGRVAYSGVSLNDIPQSNIHKYFGFATQENILFNTSIRDNLLYGRDDATDEELVDVCKKANIYDYIMSLEAGFDTIVGEKGIKLSGGERQRIVLARLFLKDVEVYIFDEATNALDERNERIINETIKNTMSGCTVVLVSHRESAVQICDRVINLDVQRRNE